MGLKVTDDLRNDPDQLAGDVGHILLRQLPAMGPPNADWNCGVPN